MLKVKVLPALPDVSIPFPKLMRIKSGPMSGSMVLATMEEANEIYFTYLTCPIANKDTAFSYTCYTSEMLEDVPVGTQVLITQ